MQSMDEVKRWLGRVHHIIIPDDWLEACIDFIISENQGERLKTEQLKPLVHEQWLVSDLRELACPCLPPQLGQQHKFILSGHYAVQMDSVVDVSVPLYSQLQKRKGTENANVHVSAETQPSQPAWAVKSGRMLMMKLTDGVHDVQAMEYRPIPALSMEITPGAKLLLHGEVLCRRGILMLTKDNVRLLGGEVDALMEENDPVNIITRILEENRNVDTDKLATQSHQPTQSSADTVNTTQQRRNRPPVNNAYQGNQPSNQFRNNQQVPGNQHRQSQIRSTSVHPGSSHHPPNHDSVLSESLDFPDDDDDLLDCLDDRQLAKMEEPEWEEDIDYDAVMDEVESQLVSGNTTSSHHAVIPSHQTVTLSHQNATAFNRNAKPSHKSVTPSHQTATVSNRNMTPSHPSVKLSPHNASSSHNTSASLSPQNGTSSCRSLTSSNQTTHGTWRGNSSLQSPDSGVISTAHKSGSLSQNSSHNSSKNSYSQSVPHKRFPLAENSFPNRAADGAAPVSRKIQKQMVDHVDVMDEEEDLSDFDLLSSSAAPTSAVNQTRIREIGLHTPPFTYLSLVKKLLCEDEQVTIKGYISTLTSKLDHNNGTKWTLSAKVNDGTAAVNMDLSDQMLTSLIGFTAAESLRLREAARTDMKARTKLSEGLKQCQRSLISMSCLMDVRFPAGERPCILRHRDITADDVQALKERLK